MNPSYDASLPHHRPDGFRNHDTESITRGLGEVLRWRWQAARAGLPKPPAQAVPTVPADLDFIARNRGGAAAPAVSWLGHATVLAQFGGLNVVTDPHCSPRASPVPFAGPKRAQPPGIALADLPHVDVVLISHNHYDHLDAATVDALHAQAGGPPLYIVPLGIKPWLARRGITQAVELDWWQTQRVGDVEFALVPVQHWSGRSLTDRMATLWGGYAAFSNDLHLYFSGDTGYSKDFVRTRERYAERQTPERGGGFDIALIAIGAYEPRWFMQPQHIDPAEAVQVHRDLGAKRSLGVHWGTFQLTDESLDEPPRRLADARRAQGLADDDFFTMAIGETKVLPRRQERVSR